MFRALKNIDRKENKGFSLVELLVVLLIMSVIAGIAVPLYLNQKSRSYLAVAQSDATSLGQEVTSLVSDYTSFASSGCTANLCPITPSGTVGAYVLTFTAFTAATGGGTASPTGQPTTGSLRISTGSSVTSANYGQGLAWCLVVTNNGAYAKYTNAGLTLSQVGGTAPTCVAGV